MSGRRFRISFGVLSTNQTEKRFKNQSIINLFCNIRRDPSRDRLAGSGAGFEKENKFQIGRR